MTRWPAALAMLALLGCAARPVSTLDGTVNDVTEEPDAAVEAAVRPDAPAPNWWSDAPVCEPPEDGGAWREPDRSRCPPLLFDPGPADVDAGMTACVPGRTTPCMCEDGRRGIQTCDFAGRAWGCSCGIVDAGSLWVRTNQPAISLPARLIRPLSGMRVTSRRPLLRWVLPDGVTRARVEVCADRPCARVIERAEVSGTSWRPTMRLPPGVVFWRVQGLSATGGVAWTSATWEFGVGRCDAERDTFLRPLYDFDGDGYDDALMGFETSTVGVLWGRPDGHAPVLSDIDGSGKGFTTAATAQGDIDGDGLADLAVGFPGYVRRTDTTSDIQFAAYRDVWGIYYGDRACGLRVEPTRADGFVTPAICDINGDGFGDVAVGSRRGVGVFLGGPSGLAGAPVVDVRFEDIAAGFSAVRCDGDANGDGYADVLVAVYSAFEGDGSAAVLYGAPDARIDRRVQRVSNQGGGEFGYSARWTDLDGDGLSDAVIGARSRFWLFRGTSSGLDVARSVDRRLNRVDGTGCGPEVPMVGADDFDGDGRGDVLATRCASAGFFLSNGTPLSSNGARWFVGSADGRDRVGSASSPGDMNGDGRGDVLLSMWTNSGTGILTGPFTLNLHLLRGDGFPPPGWSWEFPFQPVLDTY